MSIVDIDIGEAIHSTGVSIGRGVHSTGIDLGAVTTPFTPGSPASWSDAFNFAWDPADLILSNDDPVPSWVDLIGGKSLAQAVVASQPLFKSAVLGYPAIRFDGVNDYLFTADTDLILNGSVATQSAAVFLAMTGAIDVTDVPAVWGDTVTAANALGFRSAGPTNMGYVRQTTGNSIVAATGGTYDPAAVNFIMITASGSEFKLWIDGTAVHTGAVTGNWVHNRFSIGGWLRATFETPADFDCLGLGLAFGAEAVALHADPTAMFALASTKWGL